MWRHESVPCTCAQRVGENFGRKGDRTDPKLARYLRASWYGTCDMCQVSFDSEGSKLTPQGSILFFSLMPSSSDTLWRNFTKFGTRVQCNKGFQNMYKLGGWKNRGSKFWISKKMSFLTFLDELWRKKEEYKNFQKIPKIQNFDPLIFEPPQIINIRIALAHVHSCTKFGVPRFKGVRARGQKAEKIKLPPGGTILTPRGWFSHWHTIQTKALLTWKFGLPATSRLGCNPDTTFFEGFTRRHVARAR